MLFTKSGTAIAQTLVRFIRTTKNNYEKTDYRWFVVVNVTCSVQPGNKTAFTINQGRLSEENAIAENGGLDTGRHWHRVMHHGRDTRDG